MKLQCQDSYSSAISFQGRHAGGALPQEDLVFSAEAGVLTSFQELIVCALRTLMLSSFSCQGICVPARSHPFLFPELFLPGFASA